MAGKERPPLWIPRRIHGGGTRYIRDDKSGYNMRKMKDGPIPGQQNRAKWTLFHGDNRVWDVQPHGLLSEAIAEAEAWLAGR